MMLCIRSYLAVSSGTSVWFNDELCDFIQDAIQPFLLMMWAIYKVKRLDSLEGHLREKRFHSSTVLTFFFLFFLRSVPFKNIISNSLLCKKRLFCSNFFLILKIFNIQVILVQKEASSNWEYAFKNMKITSKPVVNY